MKKVACNLCKNKKPLTNEFFHSDSSKKSGLVGICKECTSKERKKKYKPKTKLKERLEIKISSVIKICTKCKESKEKTSEFFHSDKQKTDGFASSCKVCKNKDNFEIAQSKEYKERKSEYDKKYRQSELGKERDRKKKERHHNLYYSDEEFRQRELGRGAKCRAKHKKLYGDARQKERQEKIKYKYRNDPEYKEKQLKRQRDYRKNKEVYKNWNKKYIQKNKHQFACRQILSDFLRKMRREKTNRTHEMLGYDFEQFKQRLEMNFRPGMSWSNHGEWHIDHIKPISAFSNDTPARIVNALCNLQPLWAEENLRKGSNWK